jgi:hypothetical protein
VNDSENDVSDDFLMPNLIWLCYIAVHRKIHVHRTERTISRRAINTSAVRKKELQCNEVHDHKQVSLRTLSSSQKYGI